MKEELAKVLKIRKDRKVPSIDDVLSEVWKYRGKEMKEWVWIMCNSDANAIIV